MTTHVDKGHIHNHIILNNVRYVDEKAYISNNKTKDKSYKEYQEQKNGNSYKGKLKYTTDLDIKS